MQYNTIQYNTMLAAQGLHSWLLMTGGGRRWSPTEVHNLHPQKSELQNLSTQKNHYFFSVPPKNP